MASKVRIFSLIVLLGVLPHCSGKDSAKNPMVDMLGKPDQAKEATVRLTLNLVEAAYNSYCQEHDAPPSALAELVPQYLRSLEEIRDPWGTELKIDTRPEAGAQLVSAGRDRRFGTADDIARSLQ